MKKKFDMLNELVLETKENYYMDKALDEIKICLEDIDTAYTQQSNITLNPNVIAQECIEMSNMSPAQCKAATANSTAVRSSMPATSQGMNDEQLEDPNVMLKTFKSVIKRAMLIPATNVFVNYVKMTFKFAFGVAFGNWRTAISDAGGVLGPLKTSNFHWYILSYAIISAGGACYKVLRKRNLRREQQRRLSKAQQEAYTVIDKHMDLICEGNVGKNMNEFFNNGFAVMANLGMEIAKSQAPVLNEGVGDSVIHIVNSFSLSILQSGVYCLAKLKGLLAITPQTNN